MTTRDDLKDMMAKDMFGDFTEYTPWQIDAKLDEFAKSQCVDILKWIRENGWEWSIGGYWFTHESASNQQRFTDEELVGKYFESC